MKETDETNETVFVAPAFAPTQQRGYCPSGWQGGGNPAGFAPERVTENLSGFVILTPSEARRKNPCISIQGKLREES
jgi:hypothetical protein